MRKWNHLFALGITLTTITLTCSGCEKMVQGVVVEAEEADILQEDTSQNDKMTLQEMVDAPEQYVADVTIDGNIHVLADAAVELPAVEELHLKKEEPDHHEIGYYLKIVNALADQPIQEEDLEKGDHYIYGSFTIQDIPYVFEFTPQAVNRDDVTLDAFFIDIDLEDFADIDVDESGIFSLETGEYLLDSQTQNKETYFTQAEEFLKRCGLSDFRPAAIHMESYAKDTATENPEENIDPEENFIPSEEYGEAASIECERIVDGVPVNWVDANNLELYGLNGNAETRFWPSETIQIDYYNDKLMNFAYCYAPKISGYSDENEFLLPFHEIRGIFEEMLGSKIYTLQQEEIDTENEWLLPMARLGQPYDAIEVNVSRAQLGYMRVRDEKSEVQEGLEGILIPVWDFGGTWIVKDVLEDGTEFETRIEDSSMLTLDARDGSVITRRYGY